MTKEQNHLGRAALLGQAQADSLNISPAELRQLESEVRRCQEAKF